MEESQRGDGNTSVGTCKRLALCAIPSNLIRSDIIVSLHVFEFRIGIRVEAIQQFGRFSGRSRENRQDKVRHAMDTFGRSCQVVRYALNHRKQFFTGHVKLVIMIAIRYGKRNLSFGERLQHSPHTSFGRLAINHVAGDDDEVRILGIKRLNDIFQ